jgi:hypothetical protein
VYQLSWKLLSPVVDCNFGIGRCVTIIFCSPDWRAEKGFFSISLIISASVEAVTLLEAVKLMVKFKLIQCEITYLDQLTPERSIGLIWAWIILNRKTTKAQVMLWKMSMTRCCKTARLSMRSCHYPIRLPLSNQIASNSTIKYITWSCWFQRAWLDREMRGTCCTHEIHTNLPCLLLGNLCKWAIFCRKWHNIVKSCLKYLWKFRKAKRFEFEF